MGTSTLELAAKLRSLAESQNGYFTAAQAVAIGYADSVHGYHIRNGDWERADRGIYRVHAHITSNYGELSCLSLWSRGKDGVPVGVFCLETALFLHGLLERVDPAVHMAVPPGFRRNGALPANLVVHKMRLSEDEVIEIHNVKATTIERTFNDLRESCANPKILKLLNLARPPTGSAGSRDDGRGMYGWVPGGRLSFEEMLERGED